MDNEASNISRGDSNRRTRPYNLQVTKVPPEARDEFRRLERPETYFEIRPGVLGERVAYRVELTEAEYERARRAAEDPLSNLITINPDFILTPDAPPVPGQTELKYLAAHKAFDQGIRGAGVRVAPLDGGVEYTPNNIVATKSFVGSNPRVDLNNHGTKMASLACPPHSGLLIGQIADAVGAPTSNMAAGIYWGVDEVSADVISISFSGPGDDAALEEAIKYAFNKNVIFFCSMGNHGTNVAHMPAKMPRAHAIANFDSTTDSPDTYTAYGPHVFLATTGSPVTWYTPNGTVQTVDDGGTSSAAALAAHVAALLISRGYSKGNVLDYMRSHARRTGASPNAQGAGVVQAGLASDKVREEKPRRKTLSGSLIDWNGNLVDEYGNLLAGGSGRRPLKDGCLAPL